MATVKKPTTDSDGRYNGYIVPIWNALDRPDLQPSQVYLTAIFPHCRKGPHLHMKRRGLFMCVKGNVRIVLAETKVIGATPAGPLNGYDYKTRLTGEASYELVEVPPGTPAAIYNDGDETALLLNMPSPPWSREDPDEWPVEGWID